MQCVTCYVQRMPVNEQIKGVQIHTDASFNDSFERVEKQGHCEFDMMSMTLLCYDDEN